jgi:tetratricopeptide (TPR) repeat protein
VKKLLVTCWLVVAPLSPLAAADPVDNYAASAVSSGNYTAAVRTLEAQLREDPQDESTLLNLALAYRKLGRTADASALYERVLTLENFALNTTRGTPMWSHDVALRALGRPTGFASR